MVSQRELTRKRKNHTLGNPAHLKDNIKQNTQISQNIPAKQRYVGKKIKSNDFEIGM